MKLKDSVLFIGYSLIVSYLFCEGESYVDGTNWHERKLISTCDSSVDPSIFLQQINQSNYVSSSPNVLNPFDIIQKISTRITITTITTDKTFNRNATLKILNAGFGTTATSTVRDMLWEKEMTTLHWKRYRSKLRGKERNRTQKLHEKFLDVVFEMRNCTLAYRNYESKGRSPDCETEKFKNLLITGLKELISNGVNAVSDTPFVNFFPEILSLVPDVKVLHTLRPPLEWSRRRIHVHGDAGFICASQRADNITSFFNMMECIEGSKYVGQHMRTPLEVIKEDTEVVGTDKAYENLAAKFVAHNMYVKKFTPSENYYPLCAWDGDFETQIEKALKQALV
jgi:hypothetical protein